MNVAILLAGGNGTRMERAELPKQYMSVNDKTILEHSLDAFSAAEDLDDILLVVDRDHLALGHELAAHCRKNTWCTVGGSTRSLSVLSGVRFLNDVCHLSPKDNVIVSDGVRPFILKHEIHALLNSLEHYDCATTGIECYETLLKGNANGEIVDVISRNQAFRQTSPEAYRFWQLQRLYLFTSLPEVEQYKNIGLDQLKAAGYRVGIVPSSPLNFKVTRRADILILQSILSSGLFETFNTFYESYHMESKPNRQMEEILI